MDTEGFPSTRGVNILPAVFVCVYPCLSVVFFPHAWGGAHLAQAEPRGKAPNQNGLARFFRVDISRRHIDNGSQV